MLIAKNLIAGEAVDTADGTFTAGGGLAAFQEASHALVNRAPDAAADAFDAYRRVPADARAAFLDRIAAAIEANDELIAVAHVETALPKQRLAGERSRTANQLRMFATLVREGSWVDARIDRALPQRIPLPKPDIRRMLVPVGPVAVFGASNFPLAFSVAGGDTASALAAGCPVVVKAHPAHPATSEVAGRAIIAAAQASGIPAGVVLAAAQHPPRDCASARAASARQGGRLHRKPACGPRAVRRRGQSSRAHPGLRRDGQREPGVHPARCDRGAGAGARRRTEGIRDTWRRAVLHQSRIDDRRRGPRLRRPRARARRADADGAARHDADSRDLQLVSSWRPAPERHRRYLDDAFVDRRPGVARCPVTLRDARLGTSYGTTKWPKRFSVRQRW